MKKEDAEGKDGREGAKKLPTLEQVAELIADARALPDGGAEIFAHYETFAGYRARMVRLADGARTADAVAFRQTGNVGRIPEAMKPTIDRYAALLDLVGGDESKYLLAEYVELGYSLEVAAAFFGSEIPPAIIAGAGAAEDGTLKNDVRREKRKADR